MDLSELVLVVPCFLFLTCGVCSFKSVTIPQRDDPRHEKLAKRCESCRPMGMFRSSENEFLLCYDGNVQFGCSFHPYPDRPSQSLGCM